MSGYDIDTIEPGASGGGGGDSAWTSADVTELLANTAAATVALTETPVADDTAYADTDLYGWSMQNTTAGLSTVYIRFGNDGADEPYIAINLAEDETVTQIFPNPISSSVGYFITVEAGSVDGILYTG